MSDLFNPAIRSKPDGSLFILRLWMPRLRKYLYANGNKYPTMPKLSKYQLLISDFCISYPKFKKLLMNTPLGAGGNFYPFASKLLYHGKA